MASPSLHGVPRVVPPLHRYYGTLRLPAVRLDPFEILHEPIPPCRPWFAPLGRGRPTGGQGVVGSGLPIRIYDGNVGVSQVPWKPWWSLSVLFNPGRIRQAEWTKSELPDTAPACVHDEGSKRLVLSGLNHTTFDLTVYASQDGSPHHHARLASGCWSSFARRDSYPQGFSERFQSSSLFLPSNSLLDARTPYLIRSKSTASGRVTRGASSDPACILPHFVSHPPDRSEKAPSEGLRSTREGPRAVYCVSDIHAPNGGYLT